jgi:protein ATS1
MDNSDQSRILRALDQSHSFIPSMTLFIRYRVFLLGSGRVCGLGSNKKQELQGIDDEKGVRAMGCTWNGTYLVTGDGDELRILSTRVTQKVNWAVSPRTTVNRREMMK